jgi:hypothetical protein
MKKRTILMLITLFLMPTLLPNSNIASAQSYTDTQATYTLASSGTIMPTGNIANNFSLYESFENGLSAWQQQLQLASDGIRLKQSTDWAYDGSYSLYAGTPGPNAYAYLIQNFSSIQTTLYLSAIVRFSSWESYNSSSSGARNEMLTIGQGNGNLADLGVINNKGSLNFYLDYWSSTGQFSVTNESQLVNIGDIYWLILQVTTSGTSGIVTAYVNGTQVFGISPLNNAIYSGNSYVGVGWSNRAAFDWGGYVYIDCLQANSQPPSLPINNFIAAPDILTMWTDGSQYYANSSGSVIFFGGPNNVHGVNGISFSAVAQACVNTAANIIIKEGKYVSDYMVNCTNGVTITGQGNATFIQMAPNLPFGVAIFNINGWPGYKISNVTIKNMWLDGNNQNQASPKDVDWSRHGILVCYANNTLIQNVGLTDFTSTGTDWAWAVNVTLQDCWGYGCGDAVIYADIGTKDFIIKNNVILGTGGSSNTADSFGGTGIACVFFDGYGDHTGLITQNTLIGNFSNYKSGLAICLYCPGYTPKPYGITISNNRITGGDGPGYNAGVWITGFSNCTIENNVFQNSTMSGSNYGLLVSSSDHIVIRNNAINYNGYYGLVSNDPNAYNTIVHNDLRFNLVGPILDDTSVTQDTIADNVNIN